MKKGVVVDGGLAAVDAAEESDFFAGWGTGLGVDSFFWNVEDVRGVDVEVLGVPVHLGGEVVDVDAEVA